MSDTPTSPDWWLASDGKWYPPDTTPGWAAAQRPPPSRSTSRWMQASWWTTAVLGAATAATSAPARDEAQAWFDDPTRENAGAWEDLNLGAIGALNLLAIVLLATLVITIVWMWRTHKFQTALDPDAHRSWGAGWAIAGWFIPIGHLFVPKLVLQGIERVALDRRGGTAASPRPRLSLTGHLYWLAWIVGLTAIGASTVLWDGVVEVATVAELDRADVLAAYRFRVIGGAFLIVAGVAGALHLRHLHRVVTSAG